jgi:hypothetical protein
MTSDQLAALKAAIAASNRRQRQQRSRKRDTASYRPGMARIQPAAQDNGERDSPADMAADPPPGSMQGRT